VSGSEHIRSLPEIEGVMESDSLVLVVDDDKDCREVLAMTLQVLGVTVITAVDGAEALELAVACRPKLIFMDLTMPNFDGYEASRAIHSNSETRGIPIVALSTNGDQPTCRSKALEAGCIECWSKPFYVNDILSVLGRLSQKFSH
jgi:CheY-like chemotaxis protein